MALTQWLGRFAIGTNNDTIDLDDNGGSTPTVSLTAGFYYLTGYTGEATEQLCEHITTQIQAEGGDFADVECTYDASTGKVSLVAGAGDDIDVTWTDTDLRDLLGFTGDLTELDDTAQEATNEAQYTWRPNRALAGAPVDVSRLVQPVSATVVHCSRDGTLTTVRGNTRYAGTLDYVLVDGARVYIPSTGSVNKEFEAFFESVIAAGEVIRVYPDRTLSASTSFVTVKVGVPGEEIGAFDSFAARHIQTYQGLADVQIPVMKYVA